MNFQEVTKQTNEEMRGRMELAAERLGQVAEKPEIEAPYAEFFQEVSHYLLLQHEIFRLAESGELKGLSLEKLEEFNRKLYLPLRKENYGKSFANPQYAVKLLGEEYGQLFSAVFSMIMERNKMAFTFEEQAIKEGLKTLRMAAANLVLNGTTSIAEMKKIAYEAEDMM